MNQNDRIYQHVIGCIDKQTNNQYQGPSISKQSLKSILCGSANMSPVAVDEAIDAAVENGDVVRDGDELALAGTSDTSPRNS